MIISKLAVTEYKDQENYKINDIYNLLTINNPDKLNPDSDTPFPNPQFYSIGNSTNVINLSSTYVLSGEFTIGFWIKFGSSVSNTTQNIPIITIGDDNANLIFYRYYNASGTYKFGVQLTDKTHSINRFLAMKSPYLLSINNWHYITLVNQYDTLFKKNAIYFYVDGVRQDYTYTANLSIDFFPGITIGHNLYGSDADMVLYDWFLDDGVAILQESSFQVPQHPFSHNYTKTQIQLKDENNKKITDNHVLRSCYNGDEDNKNWVISTLPINSKSFYFEAKLGSEIGTNIIGEIGFCFSQSNSKSEFLKGTGDNYYFIYPSWLLYLSSGYGTKITTYDKNKKYTDIKDLTLSSFTSGSYIGFGIKEDSEKIIHFYLYNNGELIHEYSLSNTDNEFDIKKICVAVTGNTNYRYANNNKNMVRMDATFYFNYDCKYLDIAKQFNNTSCLFETDQMIYKVNDNSIFERVENKTTWDNETVDNKKNLIKNNSYPNNFVPIHQMRCLNSTVSKLIKVKDE